MKTTDLSGKWQVCPVEIFPATSDSITGWLTQKVPSHWQQHPRLETTVGKVVYRKSFSFQKKKTMHYRLVLPGVFYYSTVFFNGNRLGTHEGYFSPQVYDVTDLIKSKNELVVYVDCPQEKEKNGKRMVTGVFSHWDCLDPKTNAGGIWLAPQIHESAGVFVNGALVHTESIGDKTATLRSRIDLTCALACNARVQVTFSPATFTGKAQRFEYEVELAQGVNHLDNLHEIENARLWWTHDQGNPDLYDLEVKVLTDKGNVQDIFTDQIGIRTIAVRDWIFYLNGQRIYIKGNNYAPTDTRMADTTVERVEKFIRLAIECNMNLLRVHAHVDHPEFYRAADRAGILLWQDFPLQWSYRKEILPTATQQIGQMVRLLYNHPSIATWCCHNEAIHVIDTQDEDLGNITKSAFSIFVWSWNRNVLDERLRETVKALDSSRFAIRSSGEPSFIKEPGDTHFYFGWYRVMGPKRNLERIARFKPKNLRFVTEFGAQSFPNLESCEKFMDPDIRKIDWTHLAQRHSLQKDLMDHWVGLRRPSLSDLIEASQEYQVRINQYYIDRIRLLKYEPGGGVVPFMFNDPNPAILWSVVDYWGMPKASYFAMQKAFAPQYAFALFDKDRYSPGDIVTLPVYAINDKKESFENVAIDYSLTGPEGEVVMQRGFTLFLPQDCKAIQVAQVQQALNKPGNYTLTLRMGHPKFTCENDYPIVVK